MVFQFSVRLLRDGFRKTQITLCARKHSAVTSQPTSTEHAVLSRILSVAGQSTSLEMLLCVSGGCDSIAMLHILHRLQLNYLPQLRLRVVNFNHKVRPESDEEVPGFVTISELTVYF